MNTVSPTEAAELDAIIGTAKQIAKRYREITGRPLGVTGEVAEYEAARLLNLELAPVRSPGYDVVRRLADRAEYLQVKSRVVKSTKAGGRVGSIDISKNWDAVLLVLMSETFDTLAIYEAPRDIVVQAITKPGSKARNERHALSLPQFRSISRKVWPID